MLMHLLSILGHHFLFKSALDSLEISVWKFISAYVYLCNCMMRGDMESGLKNARFYRTKTDVHNRSERPTRKH